MVAKLSIKYEINEEKAKNTQSANKHRLMNNG